MNEHDRYEAGLEVRSKVLGEAHVQRSLSNRTALSTEFQDLITRYAWGEIWTRDGLPRHTRSLITIGLMVALNRREELALHLKAAKNNGVSPEEIKEVLLQTAIYCGVPAANSAFHLFDSCSHPSSPGVRGAPCIPAMDRGDAGACSPESGAASCSQGKRERKKSIS